MAVFFFFYPVIVTFNVVHRPRDESVPIISVTFSRRKYDGTAQLATLLRRRIRSSSPGLPGLVFPLSEKFEKSAGRGKKKKKKKEELRRRPAL